MNLKRLLALSYAAFKAEISEFDYRKLARFNGDVLFNISVGIIPTEDYTKDKHDLVFDLMEAKIND